MEKRLEKWRLILGKGADPEEEVSLEGMEEGAGMDDVLEALYDSERSGGLGASSPNINRWLGDIRKYFPTSVVQVMQKDALERLNLDQMLLEPELLSAVEPDIHMVGTLLNLNKVMPDKTRETAKEVVRKVVEQLQKRLKNPLREAIEGSLNRAVKNRRPKLNEINWHKTIQSNLKHYQKEYKTIIPEQLRGYGKKGNSLRNIILLVDQSGSMASSVVYASICGAVLASLRSVKTHMIVFDTAVVDMTDELQDPVDLLFGTQLGGGTDINAALAYAEKLIQNPSDTILVMISDLYEGGNTRSMLKKAEAIQSSGATFIALLALNDEGSPSYDRDVAAYFAQIGIPTFSCTPDLFPSLMSAAIKKESISGWMYKNDVVAK